MTWEHLTEGDKIELDENIATLKKAFYREYKGDSVDSYRILMELTRLREIKRTIEMEELN